MKFALNNRALIASSTVFAVLLALICLTNYNNVSAVTKKITDKASCEAAKAIWINAYESKGTGAYTTSGPGCFKTEQVQTSIGAQTKYVRITEYEDTSAASNAVSNLLKQQANALTSAKTKEDAISVMKGINNGKNISGDKLKSICGNVDILDMSVRKIFEDNKLLLSQDAAENLCIKHGELTGMVGSQSSGNTNLVEVTDSEKLAREEAEAKAQEEYDAEQNAKVAEDNSSCKVTGVGWIVCNVVQYIADTVEGLYQKIMDILFQVDADMFTGKDVLNAWGSMRDIANVAMVVVFLFVIFSQITGFGISNYGIKNTLPRLLIGAILLNVSYYLCLIAIDVFNIIGSSIGGLISGGNLTGEGMGLGAFAGALLSGAASGATLTIAGVAATVSISAAGGIAAVSGTLLITLILCLVSVVIGVFTLLARQIGILLLVVIAPLAFVSFILPNTKKWYDKWQKLFVSLLIIYPIASAIVGATTLAVKVIAATNNSVMIMMIPMVICIPLAAIPFLTKQALSGLGTLGARINGIGATVKGTAAKQLNENTALGRQKKMAQRSIAQNRFKRDVTGRSITGKMMNAVGGRKYKEQQQRSYDKFIAGERKEDIDAATSRAESLFNEDPSANSYKSQLNNAFVAQDNASIEAIINKMSADSSQHQNLRNVLNDNNNSINTNPEIRKSVMNTLSSNMGKVGASDPAFKQMMGSLSNTGKVDVTSIINSADTYAGAAPEDIVKMKPYAIKEAMSNNAISSDTAKRTLESPAAAGMDPQIYEQLQKYAKENEKAQEQPLTAAAVQNNPAINSVNSASQAPQADNITSNSLGASDNQEVKINDIPSGYTQRDSGFIVPREPSKRNFQEPKTRIPTVDDILDDNHNRPDNTNL